MTPRADRRSSNPDGTGISSQTTAMAMRFLKNRTSKEIHRFDFISLLRLLHIMGYRADQVFFRSVHDLSSQPSLLEAIEFRDGPSPRVIVSVNLGLLSVQTPLPSYFLKRVDQGLVDTEALVDFVAFFDQNLLRLFVLSVYPEINPDVFPDWELAKKQFCGMLNLRSCTTLHWLFHLVFPELGVQVDKATLGRTLETEDVVLGRSTLGGDSVFGKRTAIKVRGARIVLSSEEERTVMGVPWPREIRERMESMIFPLLRSVGIDLEVFLVIRSQTSWVRLQADTYLGYDRIKGGTAQHRRVPIYRGYLVG